MTVIILSKKESDSPAEDASLSTCEIEIMFLLVARVLSILDCSCTLAPLAKLSQPVAESSTVFLSARR